MAWIILVISGLFEAGWAIALEKCDGYRKPLPLVLFIACTIISIAGLASAMRSLPTGTAYAVWTGIGAAITVFYSMACGKEDINLTRILLLLGLIGCVAGLKVVS